jgi:hypothetical protein
MRSAPRLKRILEIPQKPNVLPHALSTPGDMLVDPRVLQRDIDSGRLTTKAKHEATTNIGKR